MRLRNGRSGASSSALECARLQQEMLLLALGRLTESAGGAGLFKMSRNSGVFDIRFAMVGSCLLNTGNATPS